MSAELEYRLRWKRVGLNPTSRIFQTEAGAVGKAERMLRLDEQKHDEATMFAGMPDLEWMRLERRAVRPWKRDRDFDVPEPESVLDRGSFGDWDDMPW